MTTHSSVLAWRIPGTGEPGGLLSMGSHRVGHDWSDAAAAAAAAFQVALVVKTLPACQCRRGKSLRFDPWVGNFLWRRAWKSTPVFLLEESHGQRSLVGYRPRGHKESVGHDWRGFTCSVAISTGMGSLGHKLQTNYLERNFGEIMLNLSAASSSSSNSAVSLSCVSDSKSVAAFWQHQHHLG